jgi:site-specific DNA recombinase
MVPTYTKRNNTKVRYYTCCAAQMRGWKSCPAKTLPAGEIEEAVLARRRTDWAGFPASAG